MLQLVTNLRIDNGYRRVRCISAHHFSTMIAVLVNFAYSERLYFSPFNDVCVILIGQEL